eukprot:TRINITY_DN619_c0_g2_i1.p1 TRINITY_DN619_c0_g2~~TRINITY_DN619_c0_g2_i1.p1  ORF type:complete len:638 (+),score=131.05 TRINITY_DN619_c0_g2_i1:205-2118(+)
MPTVGVGRDRLFEALGQTYTVEQFDELCFEFGIELDDVTTEQAIVRKEKHLKETAQQDEEVIYKIEVPANRYDLLCLEGLARALRVFLGREPIPQFRLADMGSTPLQRMTVAPETALIRPFVVCAILRGVTFDPARYQSFIDLQDRLHQNLCRRRTLVAIGTHDLDTLEGPFSYEALPPSEIRFVPLKQTKEFSAAELMEFYKSDNKLKRFLSIINDSPIFPVIYDKHRRVLSLPPIINSAHSAISLETRNVFIECTAVDLTKAHIVLNTMVTMFSEYCTNKFEVEPVEIESSDGHVSVTPNLATRVMETDCHYINTRVGIDLTANKIAALLNRMQLETELVSNIPNEWGRGDEKNPEVLRVKVPPTRTDVLDPCDIMEDVAIAYGYNNITRTKPKASLQGRQQPLNQFSDLLRAEVAQAGFTEVLTWALISYAENFEMVNVKDDKKTGCIIGNPRSADFEVVRTSLLPGMLKTMGHNKKVQRPVKLFELSDVVLLDPDHDVGAINKRRLCALYCDLHSGFEVIHGLVDRVMEVNGIKFAESQEESGGIKSAESQEESEGTKIEESQEKKKKTLTYSIAPSQSHQFFRGRQADVIFNGKRVGTFGIVHPEILARFDIPDPCTAMELDIEPFLTLPEV